MTASAANNVDAIVIGGGLIGLSAALELRLQGLNVTVLEATTIARHASSASAGGVRSLNRHPAEIALVRAALPLWNSLAKNLGHSCGFHASGQLRVAESEEAVEALLARAALTRELGYTHEQWIDASELHSRISQMAPHCKGALLVDDDGFADPLATVHAYRQACITAGVSLHEGVRVLTIDSDASGVHLQCNSQSVEYRSRYCINAAGAWGGALSSSIGEPVPLRPVALQMTVTEPLPQFISTVLGCHGRKLSLKQTDAGAVVIGGGYEGQVREDSRHGLVGMLNFARAAENLANAAALFPHLVQARVVRQWAGVEGIISDTLPVLGPSKRLPGLIHAFGFSAHGFALVPLVGQLVSAITEGRKLNQPIDAFAIDRFEQPGSTQAA